MKILKFSSVLAAIFAVFVFSTASALAASTGVDWSNRMITVVGIGFDSTDVQNSSQAKMLAKRAAMSDAYRQLAEIVDGVSVTSETTVKKMATADDVIKTRVDTVIKGARIIDEKPTTNGYTVTMQLPMFGSASSLANAVLERPQQKIPFPNPVMSVAPTVPSYNSKTPVQKRIEIVGQMNITMQTVPMSSTIYSNLIIPLSIINLPTTPKATQTPQNPSGIIYDAPQTVYDNNQPAKTETPKVAEQPATKHVEQVPTKPAEQPAKKSAELTAEEKANIKEQTIGGYTGLIVDCRGLGLQPVMSPVIENSDGDKIYGHKNLDYDKVMEIGVADYSDGETITVERAGDNPLVVKAVGVEGILMGNPVLNVADSNRVLIENQSSGFLNELHVVFLN